MAVALVGCAETPEGGTDSTLGGESPRGALQLETAAAPLTQPTIKFLVVPGNGAIPPDLTVTVEVIGFTLGTDGLIQWSVDDTIVGTGTATTFVYPPYSIPNGVHQLGAVLVTKDYTPLALASAWAHVTIHNSNPCQTNADCPPSNLCWLSQCMKSSAGSTCKFAPTTQADCCISDLECGWPSRCLKTGATPNMCVECLGAADCDDGSKCTTDSCDLATHTCLHDAVPPGTGECLACLTDADCPQDEFTCTTELCSEGVCVSVPDLSPGCSWATAKISCTKDSDCNDGNNCTHDSCVEETCVHSAVDNCCKSDGEINGAECDDGDDCNIDLCNYSKCNHFAAGELGPDIKPPANCCGAPGADECTTCLTSADCPQDEFTCTKEMCLAGECVSTADYSPGCSAAPGQVPCTKHSECSDGDKCTYDYCVESACVYLPIALCCHVDGEINGADCDDGDDCNIDKCIYSKCKHYPPGALGPDIKPPTNCCGTPGADECPTCLTHAECNDGDKCTYDYCVGEICLNLKISACCHIDGEINGADCDDGDDCNIDLCNYAHCKHFPPGALGPDIKPPTNCCLEEGEINGVACDDKDKHTVDICVNLRCEHYHYTPSTGGDCGATVSCPPDGDPCTTDECAGTSCAATPVAGCPGLLYEQDFGDVPGSTLADLGFSTAELGASPVASHWGLGGSMASPFGADLALRFTAGALADKDVESCAVTPPFPRDAAKPLQVGWSAALTHSAGASPIGLSVALGAAGVPASATVLWSQTVTGPLAPASSRIEVATADIPAGPDLELRFCVTTSSAWGAWAWTIDDVVVAPGKAPTLAASAARLVLNAGDEGAILLTASDQDGQPLELALLDAPAFVILTDLTWSASGWTAALVATPPNTPTAAGLHPVTVRVSDGALTADVTVAFDVRSKYGVLVWGPLDATPGAAQALRDALVAAGKLPQLRSSLFTYTNLGWFDAIFVSLGVWPHTHVLTELEAASLAKYVASGKPLYIEGGDTFFYDPPTSLHPLLAAVGVADGGPTGGLDGAGAWAGQSWAVADSPIYETLVDELAPADASATILAVTAITGAPAIVGNDPTQPGARTVCSAPLFSGVQPGASPKSALMSGILQILGL